MAIANPRRPLFPLGMIVATRGAMGTLNPDDMRQSLMRHATGDWGTMDAEDGKANDDSLENDARLLSSYFDRHGTRFWIITESDRSATTILLPDEY